MVLPTPSLALTTTFWALIVRFRGRVLFTAVMRVLPWALAVFSEPPTAALSTNVDYPGGSRFAYWLTRAA